MKYNCPKCRCGCMFEDRGKLVCMNCGAETSKGVASRVPHVHHYKTYTGKNPEKPTIVKKQPPQPRAPQPARTRPQKAERERPTINLASGRTEKKKPKFAAVAILVAVISLFSTVFELIGEVSTDLSISSYEEPGILYWVAHGEVTEEEMEILDEMVLDYNLTHESPDLDSVEAFIDDEYWDLMCNELQPRSWSITEDGNDVCITFDLS